MAKVANAVEILPKISTPSVGCMSVRDGRAKAYSEREREFTFAKNCTTLLTLQNKYWPISEFSVQSVCRWF